jgi:hypothetical protein
MLSRQRDMEIGDKVIVIKDPSRYAVWAGKWSPIDQVGIVREIHTYDNSQDIAIIQVGGPHGRVYTLFLHEIAPYYEKTPLKGPNDPYYD